jgi:hypothetical protein
MNTRRLYSYSRTAAIVLAVACALYAALITGTAFVLNHQQAFRLDQWSISHMWLPADYRPDIGYNVPVAAVLRDVNAALLFSTAGARLLDGLVIFAFMVALAHTSLVLARRHKLSKRKRGTAPNRATLRQAFAKAAPYGGSTRRGTRGKVLPFVRY